MKSTKRKTLSEVKKFIECKGFSLLSDFYKNSKYKLHLICSQGHDCYISYNAFTQGNRCITCYGNKTKTIEQVRVFVEKEGYKLVSEYYINSRTKLHLICPKKS